MFLTCLFSWVCSKPSSFSHCRVTFWGTRSCRFLAQTKVWAPVYWGLRVGGLKVWNADPQEGCLDPHQNVGVLGMQLLKRKLHSFQAWNGMKHCYNNWPPFSKDDIAVVTIVLRWLSVNNLETIKICWDLKLRFKVLNFVKMQFTVGKHPKCQLILILFLNLNKFQLFIYFNETESNWTLLNVTECYW